MSSKVYDVLKVIALVVTPVITFLSTLINIWNIPYGDQIVASLAALDVLVGALVVIAKAQFSKKNTIVVYSNEDTGEE